MPLLQLVLILVVIGVVMYLVNRYIPMDARIKTIMNIAVPVLVVLWVLSVAFPGALSFANIRVGKG